MTIKDGNPYNQEKFEPWMCEKAQELFSQGESITSVCCDLDISRETYYRWKEENPQFSKAVRRGEMLSQQYWERLGRSGISGDIDKFGGSSWQFVMKNRFRDSYSDQQKDTGSTAVEMLVQMLSDKDK